MKNTLKTLIFTLSLIVFSGCVTGSQKLNFNNLENKYIEQQKYYGEHLDKYQNYPPEQRNKFHDFSSYFLKSKNIYIYYIINQNFLTELQKQNILYSLREEMENAEKYK